MSDADSFLQHQRIEKSGSNVVNLAAFNESLDLGADGEDSFMANKNKAIKVHYVD